MQEAQRLAALAVQRVMQGSALPVALAAVAPSGDDAGGRRRALVQELAYGTLRHWGELEALVRRLAKKPFSDPVLAPLVAVALYQLDHTRAPRVRRRRSRRRRRGRSRPSRGQGRSSTRCCVATCASARRCDAAVREDPVARYSYPAWWIERVAAE